MDWIKNIDFNESGHVTRIIVQNDTGDTEYSVQWSPDDEDKFAIGIEAFHGDMTQRIVNLFSTIVEDVSQVVRDANRGLNDKSN